MKSFIQKAVAIAAILTLVLSGCSSATSSSEGQKEVNKIKVVATFYPMYEFSKQVAGEYADVIGLIPAGAEPHEWEPSPKDMKNIQEADLFVYNGMGVENWVDKALSSVKKDIVSVVEASKGIDLMEGIAEEDHDDDHDKNKDDQGAKNPHKLMDPHVWLDPVLAQKEVLAIKAGLEKADPGHKDEYKKNADAYIAKLKELDKSFREGLRSVKHKEFITQHAAFGYLAKQYGLTQIPIAGLSPEEEPSPTKMSEVVKFAKEHQVKTVFFETLVAPKVAETIAKEIGAKTAVLNPIEGLTDEDKKQNLDYIGLMKQNLNALKIVLNE